MNLIFRIIAFSLALSLVLRCYAASSVDARHPVSVTEAVVYVQQQKVSVKIDVFVEDLYLFHNLSPNATNRIAPEDILEARKKHQAFLLERFELRDAEGNLLVGHPVGIDEFAMPAQGIALEDLMNFSYGFRFEYPVSEPLQFLTITQKLVDETTGIPAEMQVRVKQEGSDTPYYAVLQPGVPVTIRFSWDNPPLSPEASEEEWEQWIQQQKQELLGITSYSSVYSFIYIDDQEIRHEILVPLATLEASVLIPRQDEAFLEVEEQAEASEQIAAYFLAGNPVVVDGRRVQGEVQRIDFYGVDFRDFAQQAPRRRVSLASGRVGIILSYPLQQPPRHVEITWDRFNRFMYQVRAMVYAYDETQSFVFSRYGSEQTFRWDNPRPAEPMRIPFITATLPAVPQWEIPVATIVSVLLMPIVAALLYWLGQPRVLRLLAALACIGVAILLWPYGHMTIADPWAPPAMVSDDEAASIFTQLQDHLYRAFSVRGEEQVYDALARSVDGPLLRELYVQVRRSLIMEEQGGAQSRIRAVRILDWQRQPLPAESSSRYAPPAFAGRCRWQVEGTVEHWGHVHTRTNQYEAQFVVAVRNGCWKIVEANILNEERVKFETKLRGL